ncbi:hypothetical protein PLA106_27761 [Pseudomonas amygdali pv. lachrymans str. M302278]|nr:hypothetical protein PLA106_27761 [Pseudomonas amygdali pv. lachrymans str. M302278]
MDTTAFGVEVRKVSWPDGYAFFQKKAPTLSSSVRAYLI